MWNRLGQDDRIQAEVVGFSPSPCYCLNLRQGVLYIYDGSLRYRDVPQLEPSIQSAGCALPESDAV
jgi:hypothetical protein